MPFVHGTDLAYKRLTFKEKSRKVTDYVDLERHSLCRSARQTHRLWRSRLHKLCRSPQ